MTDVDDDNKREFLALSEKEIWEEARDRLEIGASVESRDRNRAKNEILFREGEGHWDSDFVTSASQDAPELVINLTDALCMRVENNLREQELSGKAHPVGDGAQVEIAEIINGIGRHVETRSEAEVAYDQADKSSITHGWGYFRLIAEYEHPRSMRKDLRILPIRNVFSVYMDPSAIMPAGQDQNWCLLSIKMPRPEYKRRNPRASNASWTDVGAQSQMTDWEDKENIRLAEYFRIREKAETLYGVRNIATGEERTFFESEMPKTLPKDWQIEGDRESAKRAVEWFELNGVKVVRRAQLPGTWIPVFRVEGNVVDIDGAVTRRGMVRSMMDPQRMVDYGEVAKIRRLGLTPQSPWIAAVGQIANDDGSWTNANRTAHPVLFYNPITIMTAQGEVPLPPPQRQPPAQIEQGFSEFVQGMRTNLLAVAGMPNEPGADKQGQVVSGIALDKRQLLSDQSHLQYAKGRKSAVTQCWRVMIEWIPHYFNDRGRVQRIIGEDSTPEMVTLNSPDPNDPLNKVMNDLSVGRYDVVMDTGPSFQTKRTEGAENLLEMLKIEALAEIIAKTAPDLVFRSIDHPYMQELADRLMAQTPDGLKKIMEQLPQRARDVIMALSKQNQNLKQQLQEAQTELKQGLAKAHLQATVKAHDVEESNKTKRADTESRERTQVQTTAMKIHGELAREEIRAGAGLIETHIDNAHEAAQAERMIERGENSGNGTG
jgi:hypothetical protein